MTVKNIYEVTPMYRLVGSYDASSVRTSLDVTGYMTGAFDEYREQEQFWVICLDGNNQPIARRLVGIGLVNKVLVHPREVFRFAIMMRAVSVILVHNHPSGNTKESEEDLITTREMVAAGNLLCINVLDHIIMTETSGYNSLRSKFPHLFTARDPQL